MASSIHISRDGQTLGQFELEQIVESYSQGIFLENDLAWQEGDAEWLPIPVFIEQKFGTAPADAAIEPTPQESPQEIASDLPTEAAAPPPEEHPWGKATQILPQIPHPDKKAFTEDRKMIFWVIGIIVIMLVALGIVYLVAVPRG